MSPSLQEPVNSNSDIELQTAAIQQQQSVSPPKFDLHGHKSQKSVTLNLSVDECDDDEDHDDIGKLPNIQPRNTNSFVIATTTTAESSQSKDLLPGHGKTPTTSDATFGSNQNESITLSFNTLGTATTTNTNTNSL
eukprot:CAMPEP_0202701782 /NCGR_PEP_ID=MMETSP1385-20130828/14833_1 /ASSEMBLY_ACC=CAM_ASM_000861 /TAXON_ID=933848 /ORGANISM="Elphidium margaritaceum" /LENGTH=135 /DNA_ID=CAMNT_0049359269 /DNA_START=1153 /DNA_END=1560 /DNA_ORIENTATION=+